MASGVSVVTATLASRFILGVCVPVTTKVWSCSGSRWRLKSWLARWSAATVMLAESGRNPSIRTNPWNEFSLATPSTRVGPSSWSCRNSARAVATISPGTRAVGSTAVLAEK